MQLKLTKELLSNETAQLDSAEVGVYVNLLCLYAESESPLTLDIDSLRRYCGVHKSEIETLESVLNLCFEVAADGFHHTRIDNDILRAKKNRVNGKRGGRKPSGKPPKQTTKPAGKKKQGKAISNKPAPAPPATENIPAESSKLTPAPPATSIPLPPVEESVSNTAPEKADFGLDNVSETKDLGYVIETEISVLGFNNKTEKVNLGSVFNPAELKLLDIYIYKLINQSLQNQVQVGIFLWRYLYKKYGFTINTLSNNQLKQITEKIEKYGYNAWVQAIRNITLSPYLLGETKARANPIQWGWFIMEGNFELVLSGSYNQAEKQGRLELNLTATEYAEVLQITKDLRELYPESKPEYMLSESEKQNKFKLETRRKELWGICDNNEKKKRGRVA